MARIELDDDRVWLEGTFLWEHTCPVPISHILLWHSHFHILHHIL